MGEDSPRDASALYILFEPVLHMLHLPSHPLGELHNNTNGE